MVIKLVIFDLDGALYKFSGRESNFYKTKIFEEIKNRAILFISNKLKIPEKDATIIWRQLNVKYDGNISIAIEKEYGIERYVYFNCVWDIDARKYIKENKNIRYILSKISPKKVILTNAPRIWVMSVLKRLDIEDIFDEIFTGEGDIRKPQPKAYIQVLKKFDLQPYETIMVGSDEKEDVITAKELGIKTILVGNSSTADYNINSIKDLIKIIDKLNK